MNNNNNYCKNCKHIEWDKFACGFCRESKSCFYNEIVSNKDKSYVGFCPCKEYKNNKGGDYMK